MSDASTTDRREPSPWQTADGSPIAYAAARPFFWHVTVEERHLDAQQHVNNAVYLQWMDKAAFAHSAAVGYDWQRYTQLGTSFVVRRHEVDYVGQAVLGDRIVVATWSSGMNKATAYRRHEIVRLSDGAKVVDAVTTWVYLRTSDGRPQRIPQEMVEAFEPEAN